MRRLLLAALMLTGAAQVGCTMADAAPPHANRALLFNGGVAPTPTPTPLTVAGLQIWLEGDRGLDGLSDGDPINPWVNGSLVNLNNATQATASKRPTYKTGIRNGLPVARFDGGDGLVISTHDWTSFTIFAVFWASADGFVYEGSATGGSPSYYLYTSTTCSILAIKINNSNKNMDAGASWGSDSTWRLTTHNMDGTHAGHTIDIDGTPAAVSNCSNAGNPGTGSSSTEVNIGSRSETSVFITGDLAALLVYSPALSGGDQSTIETYLGKWEP